MKTKAYKPTVNRETCMAFARFVMECGSMAEAAAEARRIADTLPGEARRGTWQALLLRFAEALETGRLPHSIFAMNGNVKLPFVAFSTLPIVTCPGAGECAEWCYSLRAWRYPAAFLRQCMNALLLRFNRRAVIDAFKALPQGITFRLYVDGDFDSMETLVFWMNLLRQRQDVQAYGYSKSWALLLAYPAAMFPPNYVLNISSGSIHDGDDAMRQRMLELPITRGEFIAVKLSRKHAKGFAKYSSPDYHRDARESAAAAGLGKVFSCPGDCGGCTGRGHACGAVLPPPATTPAPCGGDTPRRFVMPLPVVIGIH